MEIDQEVYRPNKKWLHGIKEDCSDLGVTLSIAEIYLQTKCRSEISQIHG